MRAPIAGSSYYPAGHGHLRVMVEKIEIRVEKGRYIRLKKDKQKFD